MYRYAAGESHSVAVKVWNCCSMGKLSRHAMSGRAYDVNWVIVIGINAAVKNDDVTGWGLNNCQGTVWDDFTGVTSAAAGAFFSFVLKDDGTVGAWGWMESKIRPFLEDLGKIKGVAAGHEHLAVIKEDGTVAVWGYNQFGQSIDPNSFTGIKDIESAFSHVVILKGRHGLVWG